MPVMLTTDPFCKTLLYILNWHIANDVGAVNWVGFYPPMVLHRARGGSRRGAYVTDAPIRGATGRARGSGVDVRRVGSDRPRRGDRRQRQPAALTRRDEVVSGAWREAPKRPITSPTCRGYSSVG